MNAVLKLAGLVAGAIVLAACAENTTAPALGSADIRGPASVLSSSGATIITEADVTRQPENTTPTDNWVLYTRAGTPPTAAAFVVGPDTPPEGVGSLQLTTATSAEKVWLFNYDHIGTALADINDIGYSTYRTAGSLQQVTSINIQVDYNGAGTGGFTTLVFEPVYNTSQGAVVNDTWKTWDAYNGGQAIWWSTQPINGVCSFNCFVSWATIVANNPNATILGGFGVNQGSGNADLSASVDALSLGYGSNSFLYDFEPYVTPTSRDTCKNGGWMTVKRADGSSFKNQGDCVSYVNNGN